MGGNTGDVVLGKYEPKHPTFGPGGLLCGVPGEPAELESWLPADIQDEPEPPKAKGMPATQKERIGVYMDEFKAKNGGCLLSEVDSKGEVAKIAEYGAYPEVGADATRLYIYGLCREQARKHNSDELAEQELFERARKGEEVPPEQAKVVIITLNQDSETRKYL